MANDECRTTNREWSMGSRRFPYFAFDIFGIPHSTLSIDMATSRPDRVGEAIRDELSQLLTRHVHDPGIGFITLTRVKVSADLQVARVYYTTLGDETAQRETAKALKRAAPF